jgi:hypothetical protein
VEHDRGLTAARKRARREADEVLVEHLELIFREWRSGHGAHELRAASLVARHHGHGGVGLEGLALRLGRLRETGSPALDERIDDATARVSWAAGLDALLHEVGDSPSLRMGTSGPARGELLVRMPARGARVRPREPGDSAGAALPAPGERARGGGGDRQRRGRVVVGKRGAEEEALLATERA